MRTWHPSLTVGAVARRQSSILTSTASDSACHGIGTPTNSVMGSWRVLIRLECDQFASKIGACHRRNASMKRQRITRLRARGFRSLVSVNLPLRPMTVLVGSNGSGKTNILSVLKFLSATVRFDLTDTVGAWGGFDHIKSHSERNRLSRVSLGLVGHLTRYASLNAPDEYQLNFGLTPNGNLQRRESFSFKRTKGQGRRITVSGSKVEFATDDKHEAPDDVRELASTQATGLATLPDWSDKEGGEGIRQLARFLSRIRILEPDVRQARMPARMTSGNLADDAGNLASALLNLSTEDPDSFQILVDETKYCLPGLDAIEFQSIGGPGQAVMVVLRERGVRSPIELADASFGTVRLLALLTALHEPDQPPLTAIEEADHGLHPYALDLLVERMRAASRRTQLLVTTHAPTLVNRLRPRELVVCGRDPETGASIIPLVPSRELARLEEDSELGLGELWFGGALGGIPNSIS